jgi:O-antigen/teichoic acid export membrane protein
MQRIDIVLVAALAGAVEAAVFTASTRFIVAGQMGAFAISLAVQPPLAAALARGDRRAARHLFQTSAAWLLGIAWPLYLTFCVFGSTLLAIFGSGYGGGTRVLLVVSVGMLIGTACGDVDSVLVMAGRTSWSLANTLLGLGVMVGLDLWLIPDHGARGAAIGWGAAIAIKNLAGLAQLGIAFGLQPFGRATVTMAALAFACFGALAAALNTLPLRNGLTLIVSLTAASATYAIGLWLLRTPLQLHEFGTLRRHPTRQHAIGR